MSFAMQSRSVITSGAMASPAPIVVSEDGTSKSLLGLIPAFGIHTVIVCTSGVHLSPWLVYHWFGWVAPILKISVSMPATDWYLQHLEIVTIVPAVVLGYLTVTRFFPDAIRSYIGEGGRASVAPWAWGVPVLVLVCKMLLYHAPSSVLYSTSMSAIKYFFDIQEVMPTMSNLFASDSIRVVEQMTVTAPFYAGIAYSLGALGSKHQLLKKLFTAEKHDEPPTSPES
jgi:hypothetical protein